MVHVEIVEDRERFARLAREWDALLAASASDTLFLTWEWLHTWWTHLAGGRRLRLLVAFCDGELVALLPLAQHAGALGSLVPTLEFLGTGTVGSDYLDLVVRRGFEEEVAFAFALYLVRERPALDLRQLLAGGSQTARLMGLLAGLRFQVSEERTHVCPYIRLAGHTWESYLGSLGREHRYNFGRRLRQLRGQADFFFERVENEAQRRRVLASLFDLHDQRWQPRGGSDAFDGEGVRGFHDELSRLALERGWLRLYSLQLDGEPAAVLYGFRYGRTFSFYQSGFDPRFANRSVGLVSLGLAIRDALEEGAAEFDLLHGDESYKFHWTRDVRELARVVVYPAGPKGLALRGLRQGERTARRLARRLLPSPVTSWLTQARQNRTPRALHAAPAP